MAGKWIFFDNKREQEIVNFIYLYLTNKKKHYVIITVYIIICVLKKSTLFIYVFNKLNRKKIFLNNYLFKIFRHNR